MELNDNKSHKDNLGVKLGTVCHRQWSVQKILTCSKTEIR